MTISNLKEILDPKARYIFLDDQGLTEALMLTGIEDHSFLVVDPKSDINGKDRSGFFVAANGRGIVRFKATGQKAGVYKLNADFSSFNIINRRESERIRVNVPIPIYLSCDGKRVEASLVNISEGGVRLVADEKLPLHAVYHFELSLPHKNGPVLFKTDGMVVYAEPEEDPDTFMTGITFVAPAFKSDEEKNNYLAMRQDLVSYLNQNKTGLS
ncbi:PilZ domain-containing protein [bacterium]|nr:PilZ domain-containing protein [bacterium]